MRTTSYLRTLMCSVWIGTAVWPTRWGSRGTHRSWQTGEQDVYGALQCRKRLYQRPRVAGPVELAAAGAVVPRRPLSYVLDTTAAL